MKSLNILLLNPPGKKLYIRDYYCSKVSKASYIYEPVDMLILSGILSTKHKIRVLDAIAQNYSPSKCLQKIDSLNPEVIISLTGAVSFDEDVAFWRDIKASHKDVLIFASGDILMEEIGLLISTLDCIDGVFWILLTMAYWVYLKIWKGRIIL